MEKINLDAEKTEIYNKFYSRVYHFLLGKVNDVKLAEDLTHDTFLKIFNNYSSFNKEKSTLSTWIFSIAINTLYDYFRTKKDIVSLEDSDVVLDYNICDDISKEENRKKVLDALKSLSQNEQIVICNYYYNDMSLKDIAIQNNLSYAYVKVLHISALKKLKKTLIKNN